MHRYLKLAMALSAGTSFRDSWIALGEVRAISEARAYLQYRLEGGLLAEWARCYRRHPFRMLQNPQ